MLQTDPRPIRDKRPAPRGGAAYPRKRAITACEVCRARRSKCDNQRPACGFCSRTGAKCNYSTSTEDYSTYDAASLRILERLDDLETLLRRPASREARAEGDTTPESATLQLNSSQKPTWDRSWLLPLPPDRLLSQLEQDDNPSPGLLRTLVSPQTNLYTTDSNVSSPASIVDLDVSSSRQYVDNFFNYVHVKNPILQEEPTRRTVSQLSLHGVDWSVESCLALLICALGAIATPFDGDTVITPNSTAYATAQSYFRAAERRLGICLIRSGILEAQCLFFAGVYQMCIFKPFEAWRLFSQSLSCCQNFSFLRDNEAVPEIEGDIFSLQGNRQAAEQSVYWSAWKSEMELRNQLSMKDFPNSQAGVLYPPFFPTPPSPSSHHTLDQDNVRAQRELMSWYFYLSEISLKRLLSGLANDILASESHVGIELMDELEKLLSHRLLDLEAWRNALPELTSLQTAPELDDICKFVLRGQLIDGYEMLYCPFLAYYVLESANSQMQTQNLNHKPDTKYLAYAEAALQWHKERIVVNLPGFHHRHHGTWLLIRSCVRSVAMLLKAHKFNTTNRFNIKLHMPEGWPAAVAEGIRLNEFWQNEVPDAQRRAPKLQAIIQDLEISLPMQDIQG